MQIGNFSLDQLSPHPLSYEVFGDMPEDEFEALKKDIAERGLQHLLEVDVFHRIITGTQRYRALKELGWESTEVIIRNDLETEEKVQEHVIKDNLRRRQLGPGQIFRAGQKLEEIYAVEAKKRQQAPLQGSLAPVGADEKGKTSQQVAQDLNISARTYERTKEVFKSGQEDIIQAVEEGEISISAGAERVRERMGGQTVRPTGKKAELLKVLRFKRFLKTFTKELKQIAKIPLGLYKRDIDALLEDLVKEIQEVRKWADPES